MKMSKMDYRGQTIVLVSIIIVVGTIFLVPETTEKALAKIIAEARCMAQPTNACVA
jgi:hypothetical protein